MLAYRAGLLAKHPSKYKHLLLLAEQMQKLALNASSQQAVLDALHLKFPSSQGSAVRAQKLKQFFTDVMPPGSMYKARVLPWLLSLTAHA